MRIQNLIAGMIALLAITLFAAGATKEKATPSETGAIFSDGTVQSIAALGISKKSQDSYERGVKALGRGFAVEAENDALQGIALDKNFSDAYALAATAELAQKNFVLAQKNAQAAVDADRNNLKAYVILATADNYLGEYAKAVAALAPVEGVSARWWQIDYQRARAEAGLEHAQAALDWSNRAALQAPAYFAPLHLLHASALVAAEQYGEAADELETYLAIEGDKAPQRKELQRELGRLHMLAGD